MNKINKIFIAMVVVMTVFVLSGCTPSSDDIQRVKQETILKEATAQTGMPAVKNFFERKTMKKIIEMRDDPDLITYVYTQAMNGKFVYLGRAVGYGLPYATQYTNPQKRDCDSCQVVLPQADPNGLFSPQSAEATWILLVDEVTNEVKIAYVEPRLLIYQNKIPKRLCEEWSLPANY